MADGREQVLQGSFSGESSLFPRPSGGINFYGSVLNGNVAGQSTGDNAARFLGPVNLNNERGDSNGSFRYPPRPESSKFPSILRKSSDASGSLYRAFAPEDLYPRLFFPRRKGYALWCPEPNEYAPAEHRRTGVQIGDLVLITRRGGLDYLFNVCLPADHPANLHKVPEDFQPLGSQLRLEKGRQARGSFVASSGSGVTVQHINNGDKTWLFAGVPEEFGEGLAFTSSVQEGALLVLPEGASTFDLQNQRDFYNYANNHALAWYKHVNGVLGYEAENGSLYLVTGCDKSRCWGTAAFSCDNPEDVYIELIPRKFHQHSSLPQYRFGARRAADVNIAPDPEQQNSAQAGCTFVRGFRVAVRPKFLNRMMGQTVEISSIMDLTEKDIIKTMDARRRKAEKPIFSSLKGFLGIRKSGAPFAKRGHDFLSGEQHLTEDTGTIEQFPKQTQIYHPSDLISQFILENSPEVDVSVIHDDIWCSLVNDSDAASGRFPDDLELLERFLDKYTVEVKDGIAHLKKVVNYSDSRSVDYSPDGKQIASSSFDGLITVWDVSTGGCLRSLPTSWNGTLSLRYSPSGTVLAAGSFKNLQVLDLRNDEPTTFRGHNDTILSVAYSPDGKYVASCSFDGYVRLWDLKSGTVLNVLQGHPDGQSSVAYSPTGTHVASGSFGKNIIIWNMLNDQRFRSLQGHRHAVLSVAFSPDGQHVVSGSFDQDVRLWEVKTGRCVHILQGHTDPVLSVAYSPNGAQVASGSLDCTVILWNVNTGKIARTLAGHNGMVSSVAFSPDGVHIASGSFDCTVRIWEIKSGDSLRVLQVPGLLSKEKGAEELQGASSRARTATKGPTKPVRRSSLDVPVRKHSFDTISTVSSLAARSV
ncbi:hypothetical protein D9758_004371 [Tetrapyrgos nigripes]|uniref:Uncharacterized protein n=1 Tax=Tetrapyrgos nigripes TaxID=182062 RepID=A0A8H5GMX9_9AGAR|nr:hypothetical protein D9758_004371 [Tetrapyrgos nigripes]